MPIIRRAPVKVTPNRAKIVPVRGGTRVMPSSPPAGETKEQRFDRIASRRMDAALKDLRLIGNLAGPSYAYTDQKIAEMEIALQTEMNQSFKALKSRIAPAIKRGFAFRGS